MRPAALTITGTDRVGVCVPISSGTGISARGPFTERGYTTAVQRYDAAS